MLQRAMSRISVEDFLSQSAKKGRGGTLLHFIEFGYRKKLCFRGKCHDFLSKFFCLTVPENFVGEHFILSLISGIEKIYASKGYVKIFCRKFFVSKYRKTLYGNPLVYHHFGVSKKFMLQRAMSRISVENFLSQSAKKGRGGTL